MAEALGISSDEYAALMAANDRWPFAAEEDGAAQRPATAVPTTRRRSIFCTGADARSRAAMVKAHKALRADLADLAKAAVAMQAVEDAGKQQAEKACRLALRRKLQPLLRAIFARAGGSRARWQPAPARRVGIAARRRGGRTCSHAARGSSDAMCPDAGCWPRHARRSGW
jgi:hypothetical protein